MQQGGAWIITEPDASACRLICAGAKKRRRPPRGKPPPVCTAPSRPMQKPVEGTSGPQPCGRRQSIPAVAAPQGRFALAADARSKSSSTCYSRPEKPFADSPLLPVPRVRQWRRAERALIRLDEDGTSSAASEPQRSMHVTVNPVKLNGENRSAPRSRKTTFSGAWAKCQATFATGFFAARSRRKRGCKTVEKT